VAKGGLWDHQVVCVSLFNVYIKSPSFAKYVSTLRHCTQHCSCIFQFAAVSYSTMDVRTCDGGNNTSYRDLKFSMATQIKIKHRDQY